jgi:hypothetical protein
MAFYSQDIYRDVAQSWRGFCLLYLLSLVTLCCIPSMVKLHNQLGAFVADEAPAYVRQMPTLKISQGVLTLPENRPYVITDPATHETVMIIDTSGRYKTLAQTNARILMTDQQIIVHTGTETEPVAIPLSRFEDMVLDQSKMFETLELLAEWAAITFFPAAVFIAYIYRIIQLIFFTCLTLLFAKLSGLSLRIAAGMRLTAVAMTPMIIIFTLTSFFDMPIPLSWLVGSILTIGYIFLGIRSLLVESTGNSFFHE